MSSLELILNMAQTYNIDPDLLFAFSCLEFLGVLGGLTVLIDVIVSLVTRFHKFLKARIRLRMGKVEAPPDDG